jgi:hypothetical protein
VVGEDLGPARAGNTRAPVVHDRGSRVADPHEQPCAGDLWWGKTWDQRGRGIPVPRSSTTGGAGSQTLTSSLALGICGGGRLGTSEGGEYPCPGRPRPGEQGRRPSRAALRWGFVAGEDLEPAGGYSVLASRNPITSYEPTGTSLSRSAARTYLESESQEPPRTTRLDETDFGSEQPG